MVVRKKTKTTKRDNSMTDAEPISSGVGVSSAIFMSSSPTYNSLQISNLVNSSSISYSLALNIGNSNTIISRFVDLISSAITNFVIINEEEDEVNSVTAKKIKEEIKLIFGGEDQDLGEYVYKSINSLLCCGMKITAPTIVDEDSFAQKIEVLDPRKVLLLQEKDGSYSLQYNGKKLSMYHKKITKPSLNKSGYGDCMFSGAVKDALLDTAIKDTGIAFYHNDATPEAIYMLGKEQGVVSSDDVTAFERRLKDKHQGSDKKGIPMASNIVKNVQVLDASPAIIKSIDSRLYASKMLGLQLGVDIRGLGYMRDGGSQAELTPVYDMLNTVITRRSKTLSDSITAEYNKIVADTKGLSIKFVPTLYKNQQQIITNVLNAEKQGIVDKKYAQTLIYNQ